MITVTDAFLDVNRNHELPAHECGLYSLIARQDCDKTDEELIDLTIKGIALGSNRGRNGFGISASTSNGFLTYYSALKASEINSVYDDIQRSFQNRI